MSLRSEVVRIFNELLAGSKKISELTSLPSNVQNTDLIEVVRGGQNYKALGSQLPSGGGGSGDLQSVLDAGSTAVAATDVSIDAGAGQQFFVGQNAGFAQMNLHGQSMNLFASTGLTVENGVTGSFGVNTAQPININGNGGSAGQVFTSAGAGGPPTWQTPSGGGGSGDVVGPASATDNVPVLFDGTTGKLVKNSVPTGTGSVPVMSVSPALTGTPTVPTAATTTNTTQAASTAFVQQEITAKTVGIQDIPISATAFWPTETSGCTPLSRVVMPTSFINIQGLEFPVSGQTFAQVQVPMPRKVGSATLTAIVYWKPAATGSGNVRWGLQLATFRDDDALTAAFGSEIAVSDTYTALNDLNITTVSAAITPSGTHAEGNMMFLQINRDPAAGADTLDVGAILLSVTIRVTTTRAIDA